MPAPEMYLHYEDDGPSGPCGQSMSVTAPRSKLYRYDREIDAVAFMRWLEVPQNRLSHGRRNPRITKWWHAEHVDDGPMVPEADRV